MLFLVATAMQAQITIGGNVYGGGNVGNTGGSTNVTIYAGDLHNVYAGARQANVAGSAFLHIDGEHASSYIVIDKAYGGNDIAGTIGTSEDLPLKTETSDGLTEVGTTPGKNNIDNTWNAFVRTSTKLKTDGSGEEAEGAQKVYIGQLFGGGNGEYTYRPLGTRIGGTDEEPELSTTNDILDDNGVVIASSTTSFVKPDLGKTYLELLGGSIVYAYGGGNNATITDRTVISLKNPSKVVNSIIDASNPNANTDLEKGAIGEVLNNDRFEDRMGINIYFSYPSSNEYQIGRFFGGNNKADMAIRPRWNLQEGKIRNLYGGGNEGRMTSQEGLLLQIEGAGMVVDNVFGGCRRADVKPLYNNNDATPVPYEQIALDPEDNPNNIPAGYAARVRVLAGHVNNVYGGNDISGNVYGGNTVGILSHVYGNVYGGGNGSYAYTDNPLLKDDPRWSDFYYNPTEVLEAAGVTGVEEKFKSVTALNLVRPNAEKVSILVRGEEGNPTIVDGGLYVGGNSASLRENVAGIAADDQTHIKIGSYAIIDNVFLGNNGENMVKTDEADAEGRGEGVLRTFTRRDIASDGSRFSSMDLEDEDVFDKYMEGCAMKVKSTVVFESKANGDRVDYIPYSTYFGSFFCGGNVGSMFSEGKTTINFSNKVIIYNKLVGGCNNANVYQTAYNAEYLGGMLGSADPAPEGAIGDKLQLNLSGLKVQPMRWNDTHTALEWNTVKYNSTTEKFDPVPNVEETDDYKVRRLQGGNIYGGCYNSGHINGNVVININETLMERDKLFDVASDEEDILYENTDRGTYTITKRNTGVILSEQGMDVLGDALNVFGGGYGGDSEIWGSATINLNKGYVFQIFGGGEMGAIGNAVSHEPDPSDPTAHILHYAYNPNNSTYINLNGPANLPGVARGAEGDSPDIAECEFIYGGAFEGTIAGNVYINLNNGRIFNSFAGSCNADILGHTETYVGLNGFPWIRDHIYGGNDLGGSILATDSPTFSDRIREEVSGLVAETHPVASYMEYTQGRVRNILGGCFGDYDYSLPEYSVKEDDDDEDYKVANKPYLHNAFINFRPINDPSNSVEKIFGAGEGFPGDRDGDKGQDHSYVLIDIPDNIDNFAATEVFGAGAYNGLGMRTVIVPPKRNEYETDEAYNEAYEAYEASLPEVSAVIDLLRGKIGAAYGGSYEEGITRRTMVNVPVRGDKKSTIKINNIFGGAYGTKILPPCDVYEANVNYQSGDARVNGAIYGGNNNVRRTIYGKVNVSAPVLKDNGYSGYIYGAGRGRYTWSEYTEVNLESGANVWEVYGGGELGNVLNAESVQKYLQTYRAQPADMVANEDPYWGNPDKWVSGIVGGTLKSDYSEEWLKAWKAAWTIDGYYNPVDDFTGYVGNQNVNLLNPLVTKAELDDRDLSGFTDDQKARTFKRYNTNVIIKEGAAVGGYVYGGGYGSETIPLTGGVYGSTYVGLLGGTVGRDIYAAGTTGSVCDVFDAGAPTGEDNPNPMGFIATANAYIKGGSARNVYGGGWKGSVGYHLGDVNADPEDDNLGETHIVIGKDGGTSFTDGVPAIERNVYGGGEGGAVYGSANVKMLNGYIGYVHLLANQKLNELGQIVDATGEGLEERYEEKIIDETYKDPTSSAIIPNTNLNDAGNVFGGGYVVNSFVDNTYVTMYGGTVRGSLYGGGELGPIGRGTVRYKDTYATGVVNGDARIYKGGSTDVKLYDGHVLRNVFGGGRGRDSWGGDGTKYMDAELVAKLDLKAKGFVFGQTEVDVYGGEVGTDDGVALGYGNVFGGGDIGFVYSATGQKKGVRYDDGDEGYYYHGEYLTEDCKVLIEPWCKANSAVTINDENYAAGDYVPTASLNTLGNKSASATEWAALGKADVNKEGVIIHNAVFAGGNTSPGSSEVYANTSTVFGNATASIHDVYNRDLISIGRGRVGGLYGDGNLTLVDGYRELNITNYGTDFYHINPEITLGQYSTLPKREAAYYEIRYKCLQQCTDNTGKTYAVNSTITADEMQTVFEGVTVGDNVPMIGSDGKPLPEYWVENGVCSRYAGRPMNTIQRADFCGVFGSRMVMQGAQDRVPEVVDYTNYTINRVREVSLNKKVSVRPGDAGDVKNKEHGNYFGIYSVVNYLGALTSDVDFHTAVRTTDNADYQTDSKAYDDVSAKAYNTATYYDWKAGYHEERKRNNGNSHNKVALASGVYLELTSEKGTGKGLYEKDWGYITGVVELDLINVQPGMGGGYVYAKNEHGVRSLSEDTHTILTSLNIGAVTNKQFQYTTDDASKKAWETSGNFIHSTQTIIDDCYNIGDRYLGTVNPNGTGAMPAHYWYIKGAVYVYDQYISAYTGNPNAFSEAVSIPLTITSASHGKMTLLNVMPNRYAYYSGTTKTKLEADQKITIRDKEYGINDAISYWDYSQLTATEKAMFVEDTYVTAAECTTTVGTVNYPAGTYPAGTVLLKVDYDALRAAHKPAEGDETLVYNVGKEKNVDFDEIFRSSNNVSHTTGYILTYNVDNPNQWNTWYTPKTGSSLTGKVDSEGIKSKTKTNYEDGPTYTPTTAGIYGQTDYKVGSIISKEEYDTYQTAKTTYEVTVSGEATFNPAYIVTADILETTMGSTNQRFHKGAVLAKADYTDSEWSGMSSSVEEAYMVTSSIQLSKTEFIYRNTYMSASERTTLINKYTTGPAADEKILAEINKSIVPAYYCSAEGKYGGNYYVNGNNYRALAAYSAMSPADRENFTFNYDALDLLIDPDYGRPEGQKYQYDGKNYTTAANAEQNKATYSLPSSIDYTATYKGTTTLTYTADDQTQKSATNGTNLTRTEFERLPNEQFYWAPITVSTAGNYYVVKETIILGDTPYAAGQVITKDTYDGLSDTDKAKVATLNFTNTGTYYYCREGYTINTSDYTGSALTGAVTDINGTTHTSTVSAGTVINAETETNSETSVSTYGYDNVINKQVNFSFHGLSPTETSTLYVPRGSDIFDLSKEKIITVVYQYDYVESDMSGQHITPVSERHILNIHLNFESGIPTVEDIRQPDIILPGMALSMPEPYVTPGAYEITGGGWKLFDTEDDAERHINGVEYTNSLDPLYLYQHGHYLAYYAKSYLGETYSNHVPVSVANYHDLKKVMNDKDHHYYIDHKEIQDRLKVQPKIYINDYSQDATGSKNGLDLFKNLFDLSLIASGTPTGDLEGHELLDASVRGCNNLEFFLRSDLDHRGSAWTSIAAGTGDTDPCFSGILHGDGHTISGLTQSLFGKICGAIYNLGVTGTFTGAGIAETGDGYMENCWISTTGGEKTSKPVFGNPTDLTDDRPYRIVNCYYQEEADATHKYTKHSGTYGIPTPKDAQAFYNGEVAYNLNGFYLFKRYNDQKTTSGKAYQYYTINEDGTLSEPQTKYYNTNPEYCSSGVDGVYAKSGYVEDRFEDGDFIFAGGEIPTEGNERYYADETNKTYGYYPIWPDDYLFFGQRLNYGYREGVAHQPQPSVIQKSSGRVTTSEIGNRVYRAPAYFRDSVMCTAYYNPDAYFAAQSSDGAHTAYPDMTAIDFTGGKGDLEGKYALGMAGVKKDKFYPPLLDNDGLSGFHNIDLTQNLLVYTPDATENVKTYTVVTDYLPDLVYGETDIKYRTVDVQNPIRVRGHAVVLTGGVYVAENDHFLVDKNDFNAPISYQFKDGPDGTRMWYQRTPEDDEFVDRKKGWSAISLPFTAELVTTQTKGEITHFYDGSAVSKNDTGTKIGHEYWLRQYRDITDVEGAAEIQKARMTYPLATDGEIMTPNKTVSNTFLWDYYYNAASHQDRNQDFYQTYYENDNRQYPNYNLLTRATPYIIGFPGVTYYEFDLSGNFDPQNTYAPKPEVLRKQTISFVSKSGITIAVSDTEKKGVAYGNDEDGYYTFYPSYLNERFDDSQYYTLQPNFDSNSDGVADCSAFYQVLLSTPQFAFRPYFKYSEENPYPASAGARRAGATRGGGSVAQYIIFDDDDSEIKKDEPIQEEEKLEDLIVNGGRKVVVVKSNLREEKEVNIVNMAGVTLAAFTIQPGETITTNVALTGVYIVRTTDGRYTKKVLVR